MKSQTPILDIISNNTSLNLLFNEKRLMIIGMIRADFDVEKAFEINCNNQRFNQFSIEAYRKKLYIHGIGVKKLRDQIRREKKLLNVN